MPRPVGGRGSQGPGRTAPGGQPAGPHLQSRPRRPPRHTGGEPATAGGTGARAHRAESDRAWFRRGPAVTSITGVLVMAYGTAAGPEDIERYYTDIRGGRAPSPQHLEELRARYAAIGNRFPLLETTRRQAEGLERELNAGTDGPRYRVYLGMKHSPPFIAEGVEQMRSDGIDRAVGLVLAPHWSGMSVETYVERVEKAL